MNFELSQPKQVISLSTSASIVSVEVNVWTATRQDRAISNEVTTMKNADSEAGKFTKNLLSSSPEHKALMNYRQTVYNWLQRSTFDWAGSSRLLPLVNLEKFMKDYELHDKEFNRLLDEFILKYPQIVSDSAFKQGDMFDRSQYPDVGQVRSKFRIKLFVTTVPNNDFRSNISSVIAEDLKNHYERQVGEIIDNVMVDASERFLEIASRISNACTEVSPNEDGKVKRKKIYDTTITQARELCTTLKDFNLTNNQALEDARVQLENALKDVSVEDLRESSYVRSVVKNDVDDILSKFAPLKSFN
jgi:hypothetical protein